MGSRTLTTAVLIKRLEKHQAGYVALPLIPPTPLPLYLSVLYCTSPSCKGDQTVQIVHSLDSCKMYFDRLSR